MNDDTDVQEPTSLPPGWEIIEIPPLIGYYGKPFGITLYRGVHDEKRRVTRLKGTRAAAQYDILIGRHRSMSDDTAERDAIDHFDFPRTRR